MNIIEGRVASAREVAGRQSSVMRCLTHLLVVAVAIMISGCVSDPTTRSGGAGEVIVSGASTCMGLGFARVCDAQNANISKPFFEAFDSTSSDRRRRAEDIVSTHANVAPSQIEILPATSALTLRWHAKLAIIATTSVFDSSSMPYMPQDEEARAWMQQANLPVFADVSLSPLQVQLKNSAVRQWASRLRNDPYVAGKCTWNGVQADCADVLTVDHLRMIADLINDPSQPLDEHQDIIGFFRRELAAQRFQKKNNGSLSTTGRDVYLVHADGFSPQVDFLGDLYVPDSFEKTWNTSEQELILDHEAAHVSAFGLDYQAFALQQAFAGYFVSGKVDFSPLYAVMRKPDEMFVDLIAARAFRMTPQQLLESASLLDKLENASPARADGLRELASLEENGVDVDTLVARRLQTIPQPSQMQTSRTPPPLDIDSRLVKYRDLTSKYEASLTPGRVQSLVGDAPIDNLGIRDYVLRAFDQDDSAQLSFTDANGYTWTLRVTTISLKSFGNPK